MLEPNTTKTFVKIWKYEIIRIYLHYEIIRTSNNRI